MGNGGWMYCDVIIDVTVLAGSDCFYGVLNLRVGGETPGAALARAIRALPPTIQVRDAKVKEGSE